jgi:hypothetical protein
MARRSNKSAAKILSQTNVSPVDRNDNDKHLALLERKITLATEGFTTDRFCELVLRDILGLCRQTVKIHLRSYNPAIVISHPSRKMTAAMIEEAQVLRNGGLSYKEIGPKLGFAAKTIWKYLKS